MYMGVLPFPDNYILSFYIFLQWLPPVVPGETAVNLMSPQEQDKQGHKLISILDFALF